MIASFRFSGAFCAGLIEAPWSRSERPEPRGFPALFAPASLKHAAARLDPSGPLGGFSGAFCAGLIEADSCAEPHPRSPPGFPALFAPASLKPMTDFDRTDFGRAVFRRFLRRPH